MVRVKHRYLLINILYPEPSQAKEGASVVDRKRNVPNLVEFNRPTSDEFTPQLLSRVIREQITLLYGDYGSGMASVGLKGG